MPQRLTGAELLAKIGSFGTDATKQELCTATGYLHTTPGGKEVYEWETLLAALVEAKGVNLPLTVRHSGGPRPSFTTTTLSNGNVIVGKCYAGMINAQPGDTFDIKVDEDAQQITISLVA